MSAISRTRLSLESLETRENPAVTIEYLVLCTAVDARPAADDAAAVTRSAAADSTAVGADRNMTMKGQTIGENSAVVFVGGWGSSMYQYSFGGSY